MSNSDVLFKGSVANLGKNTIEATRKDGNEVAAIRIALNLLLILVIVGGEGMKVIFRDNFGKKGINLVKIIVCSLCFGLIAYLLFIGKKFGLDFDNSKSTQISFIITAFLFSGLACLVLVKGIIKWRRAQNEPPVSDYKGDSTLLHFLTEYGWNQNQIQYFAEPFYIIVVGVLLCFYNLVGGIVLIFCGVSIWVNALFDWMIDGFAANKIKTEMQSVKQQEIITNQVSTD